MHQIIKTLSKVADRYAPSRSLTFDLVHVFKAIQIMEKNEKVGRSVLVEELGLGEGSVKTLVKHLKMHGIVTNSNAGMWLTSKGIGMYSKLHSIIATEAEIPKCSVVLGKFNYAVLVKDLAREIRSGIPQRDEAIRMGAVGATTLIFTGDKFLMPEQNKNALKNDRRAYQIIMEELRPENNDVIIIGSAENKKIAELAAKSAALQTISSHDKHF